MRPGIEPHRALGGLRISGLLQIRRCITDASGTAVIEFALMAPILITLLLGICDFAPSLMARYKFGNATQSVADLATQAFRLQASDMAEVFAGGADVLAPFASTNFSLRVTSVASDGNGNAFVYWSCANGSFTPYVAKSFVTVSPTGSSVDNLIWRHNTGGLNGTNTSYVSVEATNVYTAPARFILTTPQTMSVVNYMVPRLSTYVGFPWDGIATHIPPPPTTTTTTKSMTLSNGAVCNYAA